jgi:hypothetical protein
MKLSEKVLPFLIILFLVGTVQAFARQDEGPPPEAFTACEGKQAADNAELTERQGETVTGTCEHGKNGRLFLKPDHPNGQSEPKR